MVFDLEKEDNDADGDTGQGSQQHGAGGHVFNDLYFGIVLVVAIEIAEHLDTGVENLGHPYQGNGNAYGGPLPRTEMTDEAGSDDQDGGQRMDTDVRLLAEYGRESAERKAEAGDPAFYSC